MSKMNGEFALLGFFRDAVPRLDDIYTWPVPEIRGFSGGGSSDFQSNVRLKRYLTSQWEKADRRGRHDWAQIIVSDWGRVRRNKPETLARYVAEIESGSPATPLQGVASYSKIFAIAEPSRFAIYDARVAACLNAVQVNAGVADGLAFNYVAGRNNVVGNRKKKIGFTQQQQFAVASLCARGWQRIPRAETYATYLALLRRLAAELEGSSILELEMALFASAEIECARAMGL